MYYVEFGFPVWLCMVLLVFAEWFCVLIKAFLMVIVVSVGLFAARF